jgi:hypothetical protein
MAELGLALARLWHNCFMHSDDAEPPQVIAVTSTFDPLIHPDLQEIKSAFGLINQDYEMAYNASSPSPQPEINRNRLPTLFEVLSRRTRPPVDLFS